MRKEPVLPLTKRSFTEPHQAGRNRSNLSISGWGGVPCWEVKWRAEPKGKAWVGCFQHDLGQKGSPFLKGPE